METPDATDATVNTTLATTSMTSPRGRHDGAFLRSLGHIVRRVQASIVNGPNHGCWRSSDSTTPLFLLSPRQRERLLAAGRLPNHR
jgi:hypothetical protein